MSQSLETRFAFFWDPLSSSNPRFIHTHMSTSMSWEDLEIASLSSKMETMAFEFADMLKEEWRLNVGGGCSQHRARKHVKDERFQRPPSILTEFWCSHHTLLLVTVSKLVSMPTKPRTLALWPLFTSGSRILVVGIRTHPRQETTSEVPWCFFFKGQASPPGWVEIFSLETPRKNGASHPSDPWRSGKETLDKMSQRIEAMNDFGGFLEVVEVVRLGERFFTLESQKQHGYWKWWW